MRVHLQMLGCRLNEAELQGWARDLVAAGHEIAPHPDEADLVVLNTCAVTAEAARKSRQQIRRARRRNPTARVVVTGEDSDRSMLIAVAARRRPGDRQPRQGPLGATRRPHLCAGFAADRGTRAAAGQGA